MMNLLEIEIKVPRIVGKQINRPNRTNLSSFEDYYRTSVFIPRLDNVIDDLQHRFLNSNNLIQCTTIANKISIKKYVRF